MCRVLLTNFHMKSFALSLAFVMRFKATRKGRLRFQRGKYVVENANKAKLLFRGQGQRNSLQKMKSGRYLHLQMIPKGVLRHAEIPWDINK